MCDVYVNHPTECVDILWEPDWVLIMNAQTTALTVGYCC